MTELRNTIICGDCLQELRRLPSRAVQMCVCSPPYWGLRDYGLPPTIWGGDPLCEHEWASQSIRSPRSTHGEGKSTLSMVLHYGDRWVPRFKTTVLARDSNEQAFCLRCRAWRGCLGLEPLHDCLGWATGNRCGACYVCHLVEIFGEVRRVLRDDGILFLNLGDSYAGSGGPGSQYDSKAAAGYKGEFKKYDNPNRNVQGLKPKDLCGIPWRVALALQADGWFLRSDIIWAKTNPMPESVRDRCTKSHEHVFMLAKSKRYYFDQDAIREPQQMASRLRAMRGWDGDTKRDYPDGPQSHIDKYFGKSYEEAMSMPGRNKRTVWQADNILYEFLRFAAEQGVDIDALAAAFIEGQSECKDVWVLSTKPFKGAHFAVFPEALIRPMILAGTSARGACPECGAPWERVVERETVREHAPSRPMPKTPLNVVRAGWRKGGPVSRTTSWRPTCTCPGRDGDSPWPILEMHPDGEANRPTVSCLVLDPFMGSGTTAVVAKKLGRNYIGIELNPEYIKMAEERLAKITGVQLSLLDTPDVETRFDALLSRPPTLEQLGLL